MTKIALFFGGKISKHLVLVRNAARKEGAELDLVSYNNVCFETETGKISLRGKDVNDYDVLFFRTTGKHWEEVDLIINSIKKEDMVVIDPLVRDGKPSYACKAWQMLKLKEAGIDVPRSVYGSLWYLYEVMARNDNDNQRIFSSGEAARQAQSQEKILEGDYEFNFPVIIKGSGGDRGTRVFKANNLKELEKLVRDLRKTETEGGKRYLLQEYIENDGDFRVLILGEKVLGVMKRARANKNEFRNNYSAGGTVEVADLPEEVKELAVRAAKTCGLAVAGVDVAFRDFDMKKPVIWEVNKGPQFKGFMKATGVDVPTEIVKYLVSLKK
ncbi:MAG: Ribosomal protein S6 modification protein [Candidatus Shapirobacteria bacterium GW2011_GWE1_38_10]|uniref:Ribosomal protein S6 modification protein n=1 Tax=Candidatus Shapirobacteria bacterium GW2011_GWE1_38_10 TaxID=1618488 RepID=A0A0G0LD28_9BACT|nr:MAG: Ribosomal protein S6 modification protein [Candidatus Shapirobacteria bacterium GW2011_GWE1_38_10]